ncbi:rhomboid family intramembrane serine protease [Flavimaricola marinus]|uniref:Rhomboid family protein n=1 Tax=Flavimaricola marinus TaxID=1819565 RepID=A0A238L8V4_9RHOB|nr:rhomboid family intramembrane serine protease [Flavimaricola marinus]SMY06031.1 Rhomboid family protein [Flavimaricola marinus]
MSERPENPVNPIPPVVVIIVLMIVAVEGALSLGATGLVGGPTAIGWRLAVVEDYAFSVRVWDVMASQGNFDPNILKRFVTYPFVHASFTHALFAGALFLALGKFVGDVINWAGVLVIVLVSILFGAAVFGMVLTENRTLIGAYPAVYGLIGAFTYILWLQLGASGKNRLQAFRLIGFLMALQLVFGLLFGGNPTWIADVAGFFGGILVAPLVAPGGWSAFLGRIRTR